MREEGIQPNLIAYNSAISALAKASRVNMHKAMKYHYIQSGTSAITLGIDEQQLWKRSLLLFDSMKSDGIVPDAWTYSGVISTLGYCEKVQDALTLFEEMRLVNKANKVSYTAAIGTF
jgi:pentatricopeptide repeat protein